MKRPRQRESPAVDEKERLCKSRLEWDRRSAVDAAGNIVEEEAAITW